MDVSKALLLSVLFICACGPRSSETEGFEKIQNSCDNAALPQQKLIRWKSGRVTKVDLKKVSLSGFTKFVQTHGDKIEDIENNYALYKLPTTMPSLLSWGRQPNWGSQFIQASALWTKNVLGENVVVAIIDSGIDPQHPQLRDQLYANPNETLNGVDDDGNGLIDDIHGYNFSEATGDLSDDSGHGTHVAGIVAADHSSGPIKGVAPKAKLLVYDFFSGDGEGNVFDAIESIRAARLAGAKVINASWGGPGCSRSLKVAIDALAQHNILFVTAAGNDSLNIDNNPSYPASYGSAPIISVGAMTLNEYTSEFSNYGRTVHIMAPGSGIVSTFPAPEITLSLDGTSMAAPFVAGAAALLWSAFPSASLQDIKSAIIDSARPGPYPVLTRGALDVAAAYELLSSRKR